MSKESILIVEDEQIVAFVIQKRLLQFGYNVQKIVNSGKEAIEKIRELKPDLVLMDIHLKDKIDGIQVAAEIKKFTDIPVIYLTAFSDQETLERVKSTQPSGFLIKPIDERELFTNISLALHKYKLDKQLKESEERYQALFNYSIDCIYLIDFDGNIIDVNKAALDLFGYSYQEALEKNVYDIVLPESRPGLNAVMRELKNGNIRFGNGTFPLKSKTGEVIQLEANYSVIYRNEKPYAIQGIARDITEKLLKEKLLQKSEEKYRRIAELKEMELHRKNSYELALWMFEQSEKELRKLSTVVEQSPISIVITDISGNIEYVNPKFSKVSGYSQNEIKGKNPRILKSGFTQLSEYKEMWELISKGEVWKGEFNNKKKNGELYWESVTIAPIKNHTGEITHFVALKEETTGVKIVEKFLIESEDRYRRLVEMSPSLVAIYSDGKIVYVNEAAVKFMQANSKEDLLNRSAMSFVHPDFHKAVQKRIAEMINNNLQAPFAEEKFVDLKGNILDVEVAAIPTTFKGHPAVQIIAIDISERKKREEQLSASLKEKEILLKEIHHRVKNNLQVISSLLSLQSEHIVDPKSLALFNDSRNRVKSMALIHERLYQSFDLGRIEFSEYINELSGFLYRTYIGGSKKINIKIESESIFLALDTAIPCGLIINELVSNSLKYAFPGENTGNINIIFNFGPDEKRKDYILIIKDDGEGIPEHIDFKSTVSLGFQLVNSLVEQLKGNIELNSGKGTEFLIRFPVK